MLQRLTIKNLALIEDAEIEFSNGLNVISGESGAGKTTLLKAIDLVFGATVDNTLIGPNGDQAYVEAEFTQIRPDCLKDLLEPDEPLILARRLLREGSSRSLVGGRSCSARQLKEAGKELLSFTGQHAAQKLISTSFQLRLLDDYFDTDDLRSTVGQFFHAWQKQEQILRELRKTLLEGERHLNVLKADIAAYDELEPQESELEVLEQQLKKQENVEQFKEQLNLVYHLLSDNEGAVEKLQQARSLLSKMDNEELESFLAEADELAERSVELGRNVVQLAENAEYDQYNVAELEQRIKAIHDLQRRFRGAPLAEIEENIAQARKELEQIETGDQRQEEIEQKRNEYQQLYFHHAQELSSLRKKYALQLEKEVNNHLQELNLSDAELRVSFQGTEAKSSGIDEVSFLLRMNKMQALPLDKGASGGELSRVNLALLLAVSGLEQSYLFDEIDSGLSGETAHSVADKLSQLANESQLLVISHLPQIAVRAKRNILVKKDDSIAQLQILDQQGKKEEIARLVGAGSSDAETAHQLLNRFN